MLNVRPVLAVSQAFSVRHIASKSPLYPCASISQEYVNAANSGLPARRAIRRMSRHAVTMRSLWRAAASRARNTSYSRAESFDLTEAVSRLGRRDTLLIGSEHCGLYVTGHAFPSVSSAIRTSGRLGGVLSGLPVIRPAALLTVAPRSRFQIRAH